MRYGRGMMTLRIGLLCGMTFLSARSVAQQNLVANPGFEELGEHGFFTSWGRGEFGKVGKTVFVQSGETPSGKHCLRLVGTVHATNPWTTCAACP